MGDQVPQAALSPAELTPAPTPSVWGSLLRIFFAPRRVFESLAAKPTFLLPLLTVVILNAPLVFMLSTSDTLRNVQIAKMEEKGLPQEQIDAVTAAMESPVAIGFGTGLGVIAIAFFMLLSAGILYFMANLMLGAKLTFTHFVCVSSYGYVIGLVHAVIQTVMQLRGTLFPPMGVGLLLGDLSYPLRVLDLMTNPFFLWSNAIMALGVSVFAKKGFGFGVLCALPWFVLEAFLGGLRA